MNEKEKDLLKNLREKEKLQKKEKKEVLKQQQEKEQLREQALLEREQQREDLRKEKEAKTIQQEAILFKQKEKLELKTLLFPRFFLGRWLLKRKIRKFPHKIVIINMEHLNGNHSTFYIKEKDGGFNLKGRVYQFDPSMKYYNVDFGYYMYDFHELLTIPVSRKCPVNEIKATIEQDPLVEVEYMINPTTLKRFVISKIAEGIMQGQDLPKAIRRIFLVVGINLLITILVLLVALYSSGIFGAIKGVV